MKLKSAVVGALALATTIATLGGSTAGAVNVGPSAASVAPTQQLTGSAAAKPIHGDFDGDGRDDVFFYVAGSGADYLWSGKAYNGASTTTKQDRFVTQSLPISGTYTPIAGDFNGDGRDDIFWFGPGTAADSIWFFTGRGTFSSRTVTIGGSYTPIAGDFDSSGASANVDDIFWYNANGSHLWAGTPTQFLSRSYVVKPPANAKVYLGNWRQSPTTPGAAVHQDLLFYVPGTGADSIWAGNGTGAFTQSAVTINGNYNPIIGNFDAGSGPAMTDIFWYAPGTASDSIWMNTGSALVNTKLTVDGELKPVVANGKTYKPVTIKAKTPGAADDILWNNPAGGETIWNTTGGPGVFSYDVVNLSDFGATDPGARSPIVGDFDTQDALTSIAVTGGRLAAGDSHACGLTAAGGVKCWGSNASGQLGNGTTTSSSTPVDVTGLSSGVVSISGGGSHTCAVTTTGGVKCWGSNASGQLGNNTTVTSTTPVDVSGLTTGVSSIDLGTSHSCAVTTTNGAKCWGNNAAGQLGNGTTTSSPIPVNVSNISAVTSISAGTTHTCAVNGGGAVCWGNNAAGQLGNNTVVNAPAPVTAAVSGISSVAAGTNFSCAITTGNTVKCWGTDAAGQQGNGAGSSANVLVPTDVSGVTFMTTLLTGTSSVCARTVAGDGKCWGTNTSGQFGNGTTTSSVSPVTANLPVGYVAQASGADFACGLSFDGGTRCWGDNASGQLGNGTTTSASSPVAIPGVVFNIDTAVNPANTDIFWWAPGDDAAQKEQLWIELESIS